MMTITQATFTYGLLSELPNCGFNKDASVTCTMCDVLHKSWICTFTHMTLKQIAEFIFEFFSAHSIEAYQVKFVFGGADIVVEKDRTHTVASYLDIISNQINIG